MIDKLLSLLSEKYNLLKQIRAITQKEYYLVNSGKIEVLMQTIDEKEGYIQKVNNLDKSLVEIISNIKKNMNVQSLFDIDCTRYPKMADVKNKMADIITVLRQIEHQEQQLKQQAQNKQYQLKSNLQGIKRNKKGILGYNRIQTGQASYFIDKKK